MYVTLLVGKVTNDVEMSANLASTKRILLKLLPQCSWGGFHVGVINDWWQSAFFTDDLFHAQCAYNICPQNTIIPLFSERISLHMLELKRFQGRRWLCSKKCFSQLKIQLASERYICSAWVESGWCSTADEFRLVIGFERNIHHCPLWPWFHSFLPLRCYFFDYSSINLLYFHLLVAFGGVESLDFIH